MGDCAIIAQGSSVEPSESSGREGLVNGLGKGVWHVVKELAQTML